MSRIFTKRLKIEICRGTIEAHRMDVNKMTINEKEIDNE